MGGNTKRAPKRAARSVNTGLKALRSEVQTLKKLVLLEKTKQKLLQKKSIGPAEINTLLTDYLKIILVLTGTEAGSVLLRDGEELVFRASRGNGSHRLIGKRIPLNMGIAGHVLKSGKTYQCADVSRDKYWSKTISLDVKFRTRSMLATPLIANDTVLGVVEIINKANGRTFCKDDRVILEALSGKLALDVAYTGLLAESRREAEHRHMQIQLANVLNSTLDQREIRKRAMEAATSLVDAEVGSLLLVDEKTKDLFFEVALGERGARLKQIRLKMGEGIAGWVAAKDEPALINDVANDPRHYKRAGTITQFVTRNMVCVPVRSKGKVIGVLQALNKKEGGLFTEEDLENFWMLSNQVAIALENAHLYEELKEEFLSTAEALATAVEKKDPYTGGHVKRVVAYSEAIARNMAVPVTNQEQLRLTAVLHDIGKIGIRDQVLLKQGKLDPEEAALMRKHPLFGADILGHIEQMRDVSVCMRAHHEKWDGSGYPDGLRGEAIPLYARIISVADAFDAITTDRPYRKAADLRTAAEEIKRVSGREFDPAVVEAFLKACETGDIMVGKNEPIQDSGCKIHDDQNPN